MAVSFNLPTTGRRIMPSETGIPDYISALSKGIDLGYKPRNLENEAYGKELANKINQGKAKYAMQQALADLQGTQTNTSNIAQQIQQRRADMERMSALRNYLSGGGSIPGSNAKTDNSNWTPGHMTPHGFEGSIAPTNPDDFYANTGEDRQAEQEAVDRIDRANAGRQNESFIPSAPSFEQKLKQGMQKEEEGKIVAKGNPQLARLNEIYDKYPQYRKELEGMGFKKTQTVKYDPKTGMTSIITTMPNGEVRVNAQGNINGNGTIPLTNNVKTYHETIVSAAPQAKKIVDDIIAAPSPSKPYILGNAYRSGARAQHSGLVAGGAETLQKALGFPNTNEGLHQALKQIERQEWESDSAYRDRLRKLKEDIDSKVKNSKSVLKNGVSTSEESNNVSDPLGIR